MLVYHAMVEWMFAVLAQSHTKIKWIALDLVLINYQAYSSKKHCLVVQVDRQENQVLRAVATAVVVSVEAAS